MRQSIQSAPHPSPPRYRPSFTLVELLVAIAIIGIMAGLALFSLLGAQTDARVARTRGTIQKLNEIILQRWEEYRYRPINVMLPSALKIPSGNPSVLPVSPRELARVRMLMLRDTMRMEMPDRITDLLYGPTQYTIVYRTPQSTSAAEKLVRPIPTGFGAVYKSLYNRIAGLKTQGHPAWANLSLVDIDTVAPYSNGIVPSTFAINFLGSSAGGNPVVDWNDAVQSSELLYLIVANSSYGGSSALEYFRPSEVADTDNDGLLEFVDAWVQPIRWIRWPAGYPGDLVRYADADAMDPLKTDWRYRPTVGNSTVDEDWRPRTLVPLILSRGQDGQLGVIADFPTPIAYATMVWPGPASNTPFGTNGAHYSAGAYYYPDPNFTWDYQNGGPNGPASEMPYESNNPLGYRANQLGSIPNFIDAAGKIENTFATDNITNHDLILEP